jgi:hypothetical protein
MMEFTAGQAVSYVATGLLAIGLYHGIGAAIDLGIKLKCPDIAVQNPPPKGESPLPGDSRR